MADCSLPVTGVNPRHFPALWTVLAEEMIGRWYAFVSHPDDMFRVVGRDGGMLMILRHGFEPRAIDAARLAQCLYYRSLVEVTA